MLDQLSPVAPARVRVVLLPIGQIKRARFLSFVERLQPEHVVRLGDISPDGRPNRTMFSPLAFPTGLIVYDLTTFYPPSTHVALSPFELYREPLVILCLADSKELDHVSYKRRSGLGNGAEHNKREQNLRALHQDLEDVRDRYPKALVHQLLVFDHLPSPTDNPLPDGLLAIPPPAECKRTTMKTVMCDISSILLAEMTALAKSLQALSTLDSPAAAVGQKQVNGTSWGSADGGGLSRRNSQYSLPDDSRSGSPAGSTDRSHSRMSMPAQFRPGQHRSDSSSSTPSARPSTPQNSTTFDQIVGPSGSSSPDRNGLSRFSSAEAIRDSSRDRVSVQGFGSGSVSERSRNKGKGRIGVAIGSLYQAAGRWTDALRESVESATTASKNFDHLWHAKALDNILVSMLMLAWNGHDFQIPQICYASADKATSSNSSEPRSPASNRLVSLQNLVTLLPELLDRILNLYTRAGNVAGEALPQYPFSETVLRFSKLMSTIHLAGGSITDDALQLLVLGTPFPTPPNLSTPRLSILPTRMDILTFLSRAFPTSSSADTLSLVDKSVILSGIASLLGTLGYHRKRGMVIRELVSVLIPGLVQARKLGAAEMGVHPAAGLAAVKSANSSISGAGALNMGEGDVEKGVDTFLELLNRTYGVISSDVSSRGTIDDSDDAVIARIIQDATLRDFGGSFLKMDILRSCIDISEALPDFHGVLKFTADLLRTAGSGLAPGPRGEDASPTMSREEQIRMASNISRTVSAAAKIGLKNVEAEYWDEFLVRGVELDAPPPSRTPIPHKKAELPGSASASAGPVNPFIYNPFLRAPDATAVDHLLVAGESAIFKVTLQNPYEFDVDVESIKLESEGAEFTSYEQRTVIGPYRTQILTVSGLPNVSGFMKITGCRIKIRGCRERRFPIFHEPWSPQSEVKIKATGLDVVLRQSAPANNSGPGQAAKFTRMNPPKTTTLSLTVIEKQPIVAVKSCTLSQSAIMILEGERQRFSVTLQNMSRDTPVDLLLFSFKDSTQPGLQQALSNRDATPAELYEYEVIFARKQVLRWVQTSEEKPYIKAGETATFEMEILGQPGLTSASIQIDYAYLGETEVEEKFHTRQVTLPLTVTVNASIELVRMDVLPLFGSIPSSLWSVVDAKENTNRELLPDDYCLLLLDLLNKWPSDLHVRIDIKDEGMVEEEILPGNMSRIVFPVRRIFLENPSASIPTLDPLRQRQFVVSTGRITAETERITREIFWYREEILKMLHGTWNTKASPRRTGEIELRGMRPTTRVIEAIKVADVDVSLSVTGSKASGVDKATKSIKTDTFTSLTVSITNRSAKGIFPVLRVQPSLRNQPHNLSLDLSKKFICNGILQQTLPLLPAHESTQITLGLTPLCRGEFEINASVEEARLVEAPKEVEQAGRKRANTKTLMDSVLGMDERRIWHSREPCILVVVDEDSSDEEDGGSSDEEDGGVGDYNNVDE
ncbi:hypothetical protein BP6252_01228 [Coleophoma cylindrospora]|uniref:Hypercellular protein-like protein HypA n=1 Tax=Coleophoma cylindrospora TaxID=1849047 RepID=A0A3D8SSA5_9HELO|nr:hypothetical protein BP6252_01228 [Coleophoma cylindrospora]